MFLSSTLPVFALPTGSTVVNGSATFNQQGNTLNVDVATQRSVINHQNFDIAANERVNFRFAQANSISLNRILDGNPTSIMGRLTGNGTLMLVNPAGIIFGSSANVNVGGLVASTLNISTADFISGNYQLANGRDAGAITNHGRIKADNSIVLAGKQINNTGTLQATNGAVHLAVGERMTLAANNGIFTDVTIDSGLSKKLNTIDNAIRNSGTIKANVVKLQAELSRDLYSKVVNNTGRVQATNVVNHDGVIEFTTNRGSMENSGQLVAKGDISLTADNDVINNGTIRSSQGTLLANAGDEVINNSSLFGRHVNIDAQNTVRNNGSLKASQQLDVTSRTKRIVNDGTLGHSSTRQVNLTARKSIQGSGQLLGRDATLTVSDGTIGLNGGLNTQVRNLTVDAQRGSAIINEQNSVNMLASNVRDALNITSDTGNINVTQAIDIGSLNLSAENGNVTVNNTVQANRGDITLRATNNVVINDDITTNNGNIRLTADNAVSGNPADGRGQVRINTNATVNSDKHVFVNAPKFDQRSTVSTRRLTVDGGQFNNRGNVVAREEITVNTTDSITNSGQLEGRGVVMSADQRITNRGDVTATRDGVVLRGDDQVNNRGDITANGNVTLESDRGRVINNNATGRDINLIANDDVIHNGSITATGKVKLNTGNGNTHTVGKDIIVRGDIDSPNKVFLTSNDDIEIKNGTNINGREVSLRAADNIRLGKNSDIEGTQSLIVDAADRVFSRGKLTAGNRNLRVESENRVFIGGSSQLTTENGGDITIQSNRADVVNNGAVLSDDNTTIRANTGIQGNGVTGAANGEIELRTSQGDIGQPNRPYKLVNGDELDKAIASNGKVYLNRVAKPDLTPVNQTPVVTPPPVIRQQEQLLTGELRPNREASDNIRLIQRNTNGTQISATTSTATRQDAQIINQRPAIPPTDFRMIVQDESADEPIVFLQLAE
jgi:filamentous hemagglutinin family protein